MIVNIDLGEDVRVKDDVYEIIYSNTFIIYSNKFFVDAFNLKLLFEFINTPGASPSSKPTVDEANSTIIVNLVNMDSVLGSHFRDRSLIFTPSSGNFEIYYSLSTSKPNLDRPFRKVTLTFYRKSKTSI